MTVEDFVYLTVILFVGLSLYGLLLGGGLYLGWLLSAVRSPRFIIGYYALLAAAILLVGVLVAYLLVSHFGDMLPMMVFVPLLPLFIIGSPLFFNLQAALKRASANEVPL